MDPTGEAEFREFVAERTHALFRIAYALTGNQHTAEDLLQSSLAKLVSAWPRITSDPEAYARRVIYREHISLWRRMWRKRETSVAEPPDRPTGDVDLTGQSVERLVIRDALRTLPPRQRAVVVLRYLEDRSEQEVADILGCAPGTVGSQASRALAKLRAALSTEDGPSPPGGPSHAGPGAGVASGEERSDGGEAAPQGPRGPRERSERQDCRTKVDR